MFCPACKHDIDKHERDPENFWDWLLRFKYRVRTPIILTGCEEHTTYAPWKREDGMWVKARSYRCGCPYSQQEIEFSAKTEKEHNGLSS